MNSRIRKTMHKIEQCAHIEAQKISPKKDCTKKKLYQLVGYNILERMEEIAIDFESSNANEYIYKNEMVSLHKWEMILQNIGEVMNLIKKVDGNASDKYDFLCWYLDEVLHFFANEKNFEKLIYTILYTSVFMEKLEQGVAYNKIQNIIIDFPKYQSFGEQQVIHDTFYNIHNRIREKNIRCVEDVLRDSDLLAKIGFDEIYLKELERKKEEKTCQREMKHIEELVASEVQTILLSDSLAKKDHPSNTLNDKKRKALQFELAQYINVKTLECTAPIPKETYQKVVSLLTQLYSENERTEYLKIIQKNNQKWEELEKQKIFHSLLNEEQQEIYLKLNAYCYQNPSVVLYKEPIRNALKQIDALLEEYRETKEELLIPDYKEQLDLIYEEIATYLPYISIEISSKKARA